ncbi:unnamed protein product [Pichia kudriavzevii]
MLRTARSLPSLRLLYQSEIKSLHEPVKAATTYAFKSGDLFHTQTALSVRHVHQTSKKETILLDISSHKGKYTSMNLQGLKMECRKRGLKVSGRKIDLVQRLIAQEQSGIENSRAYSGLSEQHSIDRSILPLEVKKQSSAKLLSKKSTSKNENAKGQLSSQEANTRSDTTLEAEQEKHRLQSAISNAAFSVTNQHIVSNVLKKANEQSKEQIIEKSKKQIKARAKEQQRTHYEQSQRKHYNETKTREENQHENVRLTNRDIGFLSAFGVSTVAWWSMKE